MDPIIQSKLNKLKAQYIEITNQLASGGLGGTPADGSITDAMLSDDTEAIKTRVADISNNIQGTAVFDDCSKVTSGYAQMHSGYYMIPKYQFVKSLIKSIIVYSSVSGNIEICIFTGILPTLKMEKKMIVAVVSGKNTIMINYTPSDVFYIGINSANTGACTYNQAGSTYYTQYYQLITPSINEGETNTFTLGSTSNINFSFCVNIMAINHNYNPAMGYKYACAGDSITSDQVCAIGTSIGKMLLTNSIGNYACGYATCQDWSNSGSNITTISFGTPNNSNTNDNVLSNQIRRILQHTTELGSQVTWTHPIDGAFSIDTAVGTGLGYTTDIPDVVYIAISANDGENANVPIVDDVSTVIGQTYTQLTRLSIASALRWAIETLQSAYPNVQIFVASPLQAASSNAWMSYANHLIKHDIIYKICQFCSVNFIDSFNESGFSKIIAKNNSDGVHPTATWRANIAKFVTKKVNDKFVVR